MIMLSKTTLALAASVALATLFATENANAQAYAQRCELYNAQANPNYGFGPCVTLQPGDVVSGNRMIGRDPDPFVRNQLLREFHSGHGGG
jgi:hypothetical protein